MFCIVVSAESLVMCRSKDNNWIDYSAFWFTFAKYVLYQFYYQVLNYYNFRDHDHDSNYKNFFET